LDDLIVVLTGHIVVALCSQDKRIHIGLLGPLICCCFTFFLTDLTDGIVRRHVLHGLRRDAVDPFHPHLIGDIAGVRLLRELLDRRDDFSEDEGMLIVHLKEELWEERDHFNLVGGVLVRSSGHVEVHVGVLVAQGGLSELLDETFTLGDTFPPPKDLTTLGVGYRVEVPTDKILYPLFPQEV